MSLPPTQQEENSAASINAEQTGVHHDLRQDVLKRQKESEPETLFSSWLKSGSIISSRTSVSLVSSNLGGI